jgi:hypothetical protein
MNNVFESIGKFLSENSSVVSALASLTLAFYAGFQLGAMRKDVKESKNSRDAQIMITVFEMMDSIKAERASLYKYPDDFRKWTKEQSEKAYRISVILERAAYFAISGLANKKHFFQMYGGVFVRSWKKLSTFIESEIRSKDSLGAKLSRCHFEQLAL